MDADKRSAWLRQLDAECPHQVVLPRRQLTDDSAVLDFLIKYAGTFDMYVEDDYAAFAAAMKAAAVRREASAPASG